MTNYRVAAPLRLMALVLLYGALECPGTLLWIYLVPLLCVL